MIHEISGIIVRTHISDMERSFIDHLEIIFMSRIESNHNF